MYEDTEARRLCGPRSSTLRPIDGGVWLNILRGVAGRELKGLGGFVVTGVVWELWVGRGLADWGVCPEGGRWGWEVEGVPCIVVY